MSDMMESVEKIVFRLRRIVEKPKRSYRKRQRKYNPILDQFMEGEHDVVEVEVEGRDFNYMRPQLARLIEERGLEDRVKASVVAGVLYLEKV